MIAHEGPHRRLRVGGALLLAVLIAVAAVIAVIGISSPARAEIDGIALSDAEIEIGADRVARAVEQNGGDEDEIRAAAIDTLREDMALLQVARELQVTDLERPADILDELDGVNLARDEAHRTGEVIYGPVEYTAQIFYSKSLAEVREATVVAMRSSADPRFTIEDAELRARFDSAPEEWASAATTLTVTRAWVPGSADGDAVRALLTDALRDGDPADDVVLESVTVADAELVGGRWNPDTAAALRAGDVGDLVGVEPAESGWAMYRIDAREVDHAVAFDTYRERIRSQLLDERLDEAIAEIRAAQNVSD